MVVKLDGVIIITTVISSMPELISVGQVVSRNALHWVLPCYAYPILLQIVGLLISFRDIIQTLGLVTLTYQIMIEILNGYLDVARRILIVLMATTITTTIVFILHIMELGIVLVIITIIIRRLLAVVSIP